MTDDESKKLDEIYNALYGSGLENLNKLDLVTLTHSGNIFGSEWYFKGRNEDFRETFTIGKNLLIVVNGPIGSNGSAVTADAKNIPTAFWQKGQTSLFLWVNNKYSKIMLHFTSADTANQNYIAYYLEF